MLLQAVHVGTDELSIAFDRAALSYGVNTLVVLNADLEPIAHRLFFNPKRDAGRIAPPLRTSHSLEGDSLRLQLELPGDLDMEAILSVSALLDTTLTYNPNHDILGSFVLNPYLKDNAALGLRYLGQNWDRQDWFRLDTRLIAEGNGNYSWDSRVLTDVQQQYAIESGFLVRGSIADADISFEKQLFLATDQTKQRVYPELDDDKTFALEMNLTEGDSLAISLVGANGKLRKPQVAVDLKDKNNDIPKPYLGQTPALQPIIGTSTTAMEATLMKNSINGRTIVLDEAMVKGRKQQNKRIPISAITEANFIDDKDIKRTPYVIGYLTQFGIVLSQIGDNPVLRRLSGTPPIPIFSAVVNGITVDPSELMNLPLSDVSVVYITDTRNLGHVVDIRLRESKYIPPGKINQYVRFLVKNGYARSRPYAEPAYADYESDYFGYYGVLDWQPNVRINGKEPTVLKIPMHGQDGVRLFIEGIYANGSLISVEKETNLKDNH